MENGALSDELLNEICGLVQDVGTITNAYSVLQTQGL